MSLQIKFPVVRVAACGGPRHGAVNIVVAFYYLEKPLPGAGSAHRTATAQALPQATLLRI